MLSTREKTIITESFAMVKPIAEDAAKLFYMRLWEIAPQTQGLFKNTDMQEQGKKLMQTLAVLVQGLDDLAALAPVITHLANRHLAYGVEKEHYELVGQALLWTLQQGLGDAFTDETQGAWTKLYTDVSKLATSVYEQAN